MFAALAGSGNHWRASAAAEELLTCRLIFLDRGNLGAQIKSLFCILVYSVKNLWEGSTDFATIQCFGGFF